jgi:hypothetical protein
MPTKNDIGFMGSVARDFMDAAYRSYMGFSREGKQLPTISIPAVVCYAFAAEVHLKVILDTLGQSKVRGHDLNKLYVMLSAEIKAEVENLVDVKEPKFLVELGANRRRLSRMALCV